jgi:hypothetical protein
MSEQAYVTQAETIVHLPWLERFDDPALPEWLRSSRQKVDAGTEVHVSASLQRATIRPKNGRSRTYDGDAIIQVDPGESWSVKWPHLDPDARIWFMRKDGEHTLTTENLQGREQALFEQFLMFMADGYHNPAPFDLPDGVYPSDSGGASFTVSFGRSGQPPSIVPFPEDVGVQPEFPAQAIIDVPHDLHVTDSHQKPVTVPAGRHLTRVSGYNTKTGEVSHVRFMRQDIYLSSATLIALMATGQVTLAKVLQERTFYY